MKNNTIKYILLLVLLIILVYLIIGRNNSGVSSHALNNFSIEDTASIDRIFLADNDGRTILLTRQQDNTWMVNDKYRARDNNVYLLLRGFKNLEVKSTIPKEAIPSIIKQIAAKPIKVEVYMKGEKKPIKIYYIGFATQDHYGNYALLEIPGQGKSKDPYIIKEAGFYGFLRPRFTTNIKNWRYTGIFDYPEMDIKTIKVEYPSLPEQSFQIDWKKYNDITLRDAKGQKIQQFDTLSVKDYILLYKKIHIESYDNRLNNAQEDSILTTRTPKVLLSVTDKEGGTVSVKVFEKGFINPGHREDKYGNDDPERFYILTDKNQLVLAQRLQWDPLLVPLKTFKLQ